MHRLTTVMNLQCAQPLTTPKTASTVLHTTMIIVKADLYWTQQEADTKKKRDNSNSCQASMVETHELNRSPKTNSYLKYLNPHCSALSNNKLITVRVLLRIAIFRIDVREHSSPASSTIFVGFANFPFG